MGGTLQQGLVVLPQNIFNRVDVISHILVPFNRLFHTFQIRSHLKVQKIELMTLLIIFILTTHCSLKLEDLFMIACNSNFCLGDSILDVMKLVSQVEKDSCS